MRRKLAFGLMFVVLASLASVLGAQDKRGEVHFYGPTGFGVAGGQVTFFAGQGGAAVGPLAGVGPAVQFMGFEHSLPGKLVKGAPYSAEAITETLQVLADGNRISRKTSAQVYRDSEGRTRREHSAEFEGPEGLRHSETIFINDPVANVSYVLNPANKTGNKIEMANLAMARGEAVSVLRDKIVAMGANRPEAGEAAVGVVQGKIEAMAVHRAEASGKAVFEVAAAAPGIRVPDFSADTATEKLGARSFDGVEAEGTRTVMTIPAGRIGNERPIEIVTETWFSPRLQTVVMSSHKDPRFGETTFRLANINLNEPAQYLFTLPADYTLNESGPGRQFNIRRKMLDNQ